MGYSYGYDQLNRLVHTRWNSFYNGENSWSNSRISPPYQEDIAYDANGNILQYFRNGTWSGHSLNMDSLTYYYDNHTNRLNYISDNIAATNYPADIDNQSPDNYAYDSIGNLTQVAADGVSDMQWTVYGKLKKAIGTRFTQQYIYDANNNRIIKIVQFGPVIGKQYFIRDAQGNVLAT